MGEYYMSCIVLFIFLILGIVNINYGINKKDVGNILIGGISLIIFIGLLVGILYLK